MNTEFQRINCFSPLPWIKAINQFLGLILVSEWIRLFMAGFFSTYGFTARVSHIFKATPHNILNQALLHHMPTLSSLNLLVACIILIVGVAALLGLLQWIVNWFVFGIFMVYTLTHLGYPGTWLFEYAAPCLFSLMIAFATSQNWRIHSIKGKIFSLHITPTLPIYARVFIAFLLSLLTMYLISASKNSNDLSQLAGLLSASVLFISYLLSDYFNHHYADKSDLTTQSVFYQTWIQCHWIDYLYMTIGIILVCQVDMDTYLNWFSVAGYKALIDSYLQHSNAPHMMKLFLSFSENASQTLAPLQNAIENFLAIAAVLLLYRLPVCLGIFGLCTLLTLSELGAPATWPIVAGSELTWTWELSSITVIAGMITLYQATQYLKAETFTKLSLGPKAWGNIKWYYALMIALCISVSIAYLIHASGSLKDLNDLFMIKSSCTCFLYLCLTIAIDRERT